MNELRLDVLEIPAASLGGEWCYPPLKTKTEPPKFELNDPRLPAEEYEYFGWQYHWNQLPYSIQNSYDRNRTGRQFKTAVLENRRLRAVFLPEFGGRLWSLFDKEKERELLFRNPVFQPGNLALRNAWNAGGIEWNFGWPGHHPYTFSPVFTAEVRGPSYPVLRFYDWERKRQFLWQIDFFFPDADSEFLFSAARISNPSSAEIPVYYWTNIAMSQTSKSRVLVPAQFAISGDRIAEAPIDNGLDITRPTDSPNACGYFFYLKPGVRRWGAAVDGDGKGLIFCANPLLRGRRLFTWGSSQGGRHWQEFLSEPGNAYFEIQSGLTKTQYESIPLPGKSALTWSEAFGPLDLDPVVARGEWDAAVAAAADNLEERLSRLQFDGIRQIAMTALGNEPVKLLQHGTGWAALEKRRHRKNTLMPRFHRSTSFPAESMNELQQPWLQLLDGALPPDEMILLPSWQIQSEWQELLRQARERVGDGSIWVNYQLALGAYDAKDFAGALELLQKAPASTGKVLAAVERFKGILHQILGNTAAALAAWTTALTADAGEETLLYEASGLFFAAGRAADFQKLLPAAAATGSGRLRYLAARTALELDDFETVEGILSTPFEVPEMREGEASLSDLFFRLRTKQLAREKGEEWNEEFMAQQMSEFADRVPRFLDFRAKHYQPR